MSSIVVDMDYFIKMVRDRPVLWDKTLDNYKCREDTQNAWGEIGKVLCSDYDSKNAQEQRNIQTYLQTKWVNVRDYWMRWRRRSAERKGNIKKYIYSDNLCFLKKSVPKVGKEKEGEDNDEEIPDDPSNDNDQGNDSSNDQAPTNNSSNDQGPANDSSNDQGPANDSSNDLGSTNDSDVSVQEDSEVSKRSAYSKTADLFTNGKKKKSPLTKSVPKNLEQATVVLGKKTTRQSVKRKAEEAATNGIKCQGKSGKDKTNKSPKVEPSNEAKNALNNGPENRHLSFFRSCLPPMATFNDDETLEFQMIVLNAIHGIRTRRKMSSQDTTQ